MTVDRDDGVVDWRVLEIASPKSPGQIHVFVMERCIKSWGEGPGAGGSITVKAWHVAGEGAQPDRYEPQLVASMGGNFRPDASAESLGWWFKLTGGTMQVKEPFRGMRLGTYLQNEVVRWALGQGLPGRIEKIFLGSGDAANEKARDRRNRFYEQFGLRFHWAEIPGQLERAEGSSLPELTMRDIKERPFIHGVTTLAPAKAIQSYAQRAERAEAKARDAARGLECAKASYTAELRGAHMQTLVYRSIAIALALVILAIVAFRQTFFA